MSIQNADNATVLRICSDDKMREVYSTIDLIIVSERQ